MQNLLFDFIEQYVLLNDDEKHAIISLDIFKTLKKGTVLLKEGDRSLESFFVLKGCIRIYYVLDGDEKTTEFYTEMEGLTPNCVITKQPSDYYVETTEDSILAISKQSMEAEIFEKFPKFESLCRVLSEELLVKQQINFDEFKTSSPEQRYLTLLEKRPGLVQRVPQHQLASYLGVKPQSLSRLKARIIDKSKS